MLRHRKFIKQWCICVTLFLGTLFCGTQVEAQEKQMAYSEQQLLENPNLVPLLFGKGEIVLKQIPDPHWRDDGCIACHSKKPDKKGLHLRGADVDAMCNRCHSVVPIHSYHHPSAIKSPKSMQARMPRSFKQSIKQNKGKITCITCHDSPMQCLPKHKQERGLNPLFFREGPYRTRDAICYRCHKESAYTRLNPHKQINARGDFKEKICGVCHQGIEQLSTTKSIQDVVFNVEDDLSNICTGCHPKQPHPGGASIFGAKRKQPPNHLVVPSNRVRERMAQKQKENDIILPLEPESGKIFCGTCHNPHAKGVIKDPAAARGAESKNRSRAQKICDICHEM